MMCSHCKMILSIVHTSSQTTWMFSTNDTSLASCSSLHTTFCIASHNTSFLSRFTRMQNDWNPPDSAKMKIDSGTASVESIYWDPPQQIGITQADLVYFPLSNVLGLQCRNSFSKWPSTSAAPWLEDSMTVCNNLDMHHRRFSFKRYSTENFNKLLRIVALENKPR